MSEVKWTKEQQQAINEKGSNILVAAAAGSGKTAVLVERIINKVINDNVDIDKILVVTFTNAAASEMRERILEAIYKKIEENPEDKNLQRQIILLNKASICTIHAFCLEVIKNNFFEIDASANFRIGDTAEIELLKQEVLEDLFEEKYLNQDKEFIKLVSTYTTYRDDDPLKELILSIYKNIQSNPFPEKWLNEKVELFNLKKNIEQDFAETIWGKILLDNVKDELNDAILKLKKIEKALQKFDELNKYKLVISSDIVRLETLVNHLTKWDDAYNLINTLELQKWPVDKKITLDLKEQAKEVRDLVRKKITSIKQKILLSDSKSANQDISEMYPILNSLKNIILDFGALFQKRKKEKNIIDFNDIEHFALKILVKENNDQIEESEVAKKYKKKFEEIAIDEYQDSNMVQEYILKSVSKGNNTFMVGDVKQSIYKFRQARPELFLEKYENYQLKGQDTKNGLKIQLFKNFRSRENILDITNKIFESIMSKKLGDIVYNKTEFLNLGANYPEFQENDKQYAGIAELDIIDLKEPEVNIYKTSDEELEDESDDSEERIEDIVLEAKFVAKRINQILNSNYMVYDRKKGYRLVTYKDIVVLLRSTKIAAPIFEREINSYNFPVFSDTSSEYLGTMEIQTIISLLKVIDNPMQDIPLITVLRSSIGNFTDNDLIEIRMCDCNLSFYESLVKAKKELQSKEITEKINVFLTNVEKWQKQEKYMTLDELIWQIYLDTGFYNYVTLMQNGSVRQANLKMLFERAKQYESASFKGLFNFINFIEKLHSNSGDLSSAKIIGENENVIRIMSIHKSKGLEFPIVFLSNTGKSFNFQDLNQSIILHQDIGFGPKYINEQRRIEYTTLAKEAIKMKSKIETMSEEMRVLYVALTRAKEKIIITGLSKDFQKNLQEKQQLIEIYKEDDRKINYALLKKYKTYLDWIEIVDLYSKETMSKILKTNVYKKDELLKMFKQDSNDEKEENIQDKINKNLKEYVDKKNLKELETKLKWKYEYIESSTIPTKTSVTKVKEAQNEKVISIEEIQEKVQNFEMEKPKFINNIETVVSGAKKGTLMHLCLQKLKLNKEYTREDIHRLINDLVSKNIITKLESEAINIKKLEEFIKSDLWKELNQAKLVKREQPFYISLKSSEIYDDKSNDNILVQGIIDLYYIDQNDNLVLVDYKTDYVENGKEKELVDKYKKQLDIYADALEKSLNRRVDKICIYSIYLNKNINIR